MTDDERNAVALEYLTAFDNAGVRPGGGSILDLFAEDAQVYFPKWGVATGKTEIGRMFGDVGPTIRSILHDYDTFNYVMTGSDVFAVEGTSSGEHRGGPRQAGTSHSGRWCDIFEVRDNLIHRCFLYLDPDYAGKDTERYPRLSENGRDAARPIA